jgi:anti-sigma factor RsiW
MVSAAAAASVVVVVMRGEDDQRMLGDAISAHLRSLQADHLTDVLSTDQHTVKPWFNGKLDFAPPVVDLAPQGFPLVGGRLDHVGGHEAAALVFRRRAHVINLFIWPGDAPAVPRAEVRQGYNLVTWSEKGLTMWAVSDVGAADLGQFQTAYAAATR